MWSHSAHGVVRCDEPAFAWMFIARAPKDRSQTFFLPPKPRPLQEPIAPLSLVNKSQGLG
jgi:hypothetical protein